MHDPADRTGDVDEPAEEARRLEPGTKVEVRTRLDRNRWSKGFRVLAVGDDGYDLARASDGATMPVRFAFADVRQERKRNTWWY